MPKSRQQRRQDARKGKNVKKNEATVLWIAAAVILMVAITAVGFFAAGGLELFDSDAKSDINITSSEGKGENGASSLAAGEETMFDREPNVTGEHERVKFVMENGGEFIVELYPEYAPQTVENFKTLVSQGFYNGLTFHRVADGFMAQGGDPKGDGTGGSDKTIKGEFVSNGFSQNTLSHQRGVISMARSKDMNSASSQFFICYGDESFLDGDYAAFGKVIEGMETVDKFLDIEREMNELGEAATPKTPIIIKSATLE